jgi:para-nitrobenzyl esterase
VAQQPLVTTTLGPVLGKWDGESARFLGIPYAKPPVGDLRFAAPVAPDAWTEPLDATEYGATAQLETLGGGPTIIPEPSIAGDDVLNINVFTPNPTAEVSLPVLVWIHGGGFVAGSAASPWYDGKAFNRDGVVTVALGYRLGIEGFLHVEDGPDNRGVLDWIAALTWVKDNIAAFGGDASKITIAGQSAGGGAVQTLMATPSAQDLFHGVISVSGAVMQPQSREAGLAIAERFTARTGVPATAAALKDLTGLELLDLQNKTMAPEGGGEPTPELLFAPFADGELIPEDVYGAFRNGNASAVPLMLGATHHEFNFALEMSASDAPIEAAYGMLASLGLSPEATAKFVALHEGDKPSKLMGQALTDWLFRAASIDISESRAAQGRPTWFYSFEWLSSSPTFGGQSFHCLDLPFAFDCLAAEGAENATGPGAPQALADAMHAAWVSFIKSGNPGADWPVYTTDKRETKVWDVEPKIESDFLAGEREIWLNR